MIDRFWSKIRSKLQFSFLSIVTNNISKNSLYLLLLEIKQNISDHFRIFKDNNPNSKTFQGWETFFPKVLDFPGFSRIVATLFFAKLLKRLSKAVKLLYSFMLAKKCPTFLGKLPYSFSLARLPFLLSKAALSS